MRIQNGHHCFMNRYYIPLVTNMLDLHITIKLHQISYIYFRVDSPPPINWIELIQHFLQTIFLHPSFGYINIIKESDLYYMYIYYYNGKIKPPIMDTYKTQKRRLIDQHKKNIHFKTATNNKFLFV